MPRSPSPAQRAASRANGSQSRGPKTSESRQKSAQNSRKWGLFAKTAALPHEQKEYGDRCTVWHEYYQPQSPASMHSTNECARATLLADGCDHYRLAEIEHQTTVERQKWHVGQNRKVDRLAKELPIQTEITYQKLMAFSGGVRWVIQCFQDTIIDLQTHGYLPPKDLDLAIRLFGVTPTPDRIRQDLMAYVVFVYNLACTPGVSPALIQEWLERGNRPDVMQGVPDGLEVRAGGLVQSATTGVDAMLLAPCRVRAGDSQNEPEDRPGASAQRLDESTVSVDVRPLGLARQNGDLTPVPTRENMPPGAPAHGGGPNGAGDVLGGEASPLPAWAASVPVSFRRTADRLFAIEAPPVAEGAT